ncbi:MAG: hypothetical protein A2383_03220 [Candidatus Pacebacteria bacterium RIFOXYB1_FULL_39_46]|nr:MAG: hypothetical protein A2182_01265 [Candidatus Pacebacteria bacterium RIFOXYA1_FULL_38_18]OGJ38428.1 MAG: hypothetical protein A2383_03220 [Candidatus Pacebacteria bacterium RIFOXYB1_FULL_39_46]OGJ40289.1 MAG: hypothetical protein A2411_03365 [Candidatus Pacebacteria bacterium RIFOXYC1_FULL_39_21]OGJ40861.1 MAG: hypothetical protein A2582_02100 [Candidatus Pacebacteria bacterium RIFOXYD1_FULL_39_27]
MDPEELNFETIKTEHTAFYANFLVALSGLPAQYDFERGWGVPKIEPTIDYIGLCLLAEILPKEMTANTFAVEPDIEVDGIILKESPDIKEIKVFFEDGYFEIDVIPQKGNEGDSDLATYEEVYWVISGEKASPILIELVNQDNKTRTEIPKCEYRKLLQKWGLLRFFKQGITQLHHQPQFEESE